MRLLILSSMTASLLHAQLYSGIIDSARATTQWTSAGATIVNRTTQCGSTISAYTGTADTINNAIAACSSGQFVLLGSGTFNISTGIIFNGKSSVTLRGSGPDSTLIVSTADNAAAACGGVHGDICVIGSNYVYPGGEGNTTNWTATYTQGTTTITVDSKTNMQVGTLLHLDQINDTDSTPAVPVCLGSPNCSQSGAYPPSSSNRENRDQFQAVTVTSISGGACPCTIGISPGIYMPNWRLSQTPQAYYSSSLPVTGVGIEDLSLTVSSTDQDQAITFFNATDSWVKNVRTIRPKQKHIRIGESQHITVRDSYMFSNQDHDDPTGPQHDSYGISCAKCSDILVENNIFQWVIVPMMNEAGQGNVFAYNFSINGQFGPGTWMQASSYNHDGGSSFILWEGNDGLGLHLDNYFGQAHFVTAFRNRWAGWEPQPAVLTNQTVPVMIDARNRYANIIGNVLGTNSYHTKYATLAGASVTDCVLSIFAIGLGSNCDNGGSDPFPTNDAPTVNSLMRWGNYDTVNDASRFEASEVPSGESNYPNAVPGSETLASSFYLSARPSSWWKVNAITSAWPPIGPDVTGGSISDVGGHAYRIPARICFEDIMGGTFSDTTAKTFNATACYSAASDSTAPAKSGGGAKHGGGAKIGDE